MNILRCFGVGTIAILLLLSLFVPSVNACSCMPSHPQTHFCKADYIVLIRVLRRSHQLVENHMAYKIEIKKSYKMSEQAQSILNHGRITTAISSSKCGVDLRVGKLYVVASSKQKLSLCDYIKEYQQMSTVERRGFTGAYRKGCACTINFCIGECLKHNDNSCSWSPFKKCESNFSSCVPTVYRTPDGAIKKCNWKRLPPYKACLLNP